MGYLFTIVSIHQMLLFIARAQLQARQKAEFPYIKCYCLSRPLNCVSNPGTGSFHTSNVTVYQDIVDTAFLKKVCFHTSNVTVYPRLNVNASECLKVSIHQMLLFISRNRLCPICAWRVSIHQMLLFIL